MPDVLTPPLALAALVLCVAGLSKLRSPGAAVDALRSVGPGRAMTTAASTGLVRAFALLELALGGLCLARPSSASAGAVACVYAGFSALALILARRRSPCGCFGGHREPASGAQSLLSAALAVVAVGAAIWGSHGVPWLLGRPAITAVALTVGLAGGAYALVIAYTELPLAWSAWTGGSR